MPPTDNPETLIPPVVREATRGAVTPTLDFNAHPVRMDRRGLAAFITKHFFPVSPRSLEVWPLTWQHVNGKAVGTTREAAAVAQAKVDAAPPIRSGKRAADL